MGPYIDSYTSALLTNLSGTSRGFAHLATGMLALGEMAATGIASVVGAAAGGAALGGLAAFEVSRTRNRGRVAAEKRRLDEERRRFQAAAEGSQDAFYILDSVRDASGSITDFTFRYVNAHTERRLAMTSEQLLGASYRKQMGAILGDQHFQRYCNVAATGVALTLEFPVTEKGSQITWLRHSVVKLGDGIAVSSSDLSEFKSVQDSFHSVSKFSEHIFEQAPFSIIATDASGTITAMNLEAERLTGYDSEELVGIASLLRLHDPQELRQRAMARHAEYGGTLEGINLLVNPRGGSHEEGTVQEWTFIRRDGTRIPVGLAIKVLKGTSGERTGLIGIAYDTTRRKLQEPDSAAPPMQDGLTGLIGQSLLEDRISQAIKRSKRAGTKVAVLTIDIDHFKRINDALGHPVGDEILTEAASRLVAKIRISDTVARVGGDEFIVVISDQTQISNIEFCAEQLLRAISSPYLVDEHTINVTASVGVCVYPDLAGDTEHLLRRSEAAMYSAKEAGRHRAALFTPDMLEDAYSRLSMEGALRQALDREELFIEYQPQVSLPAGKVIGMEALLRWRHPRFGLVSPAHFIPMAEKIGLLPEFGMWAMRRACKETKWMQERLGRRVSLSVNLSPNQFQQQKLLKTIEESLEDSGLAAGDLEIEIIENTLMINSTANLKTLQMIRDLGVGLSIDDFGTGFCNFNYLLQYQVDRLKIDQSFVRQAASDVNAASVVRTVIAMSHGLGVKVIAEGVETRDQLKFLMRRRCDQAQGYFFARPLSPQGLVDAVAGIEAMNLSDPSGERAAAVIAAEEKIEFVRPDGTSGIHSVALG